MAYSSNNAYNTNPYAAEDTSYNPYGSQNATTTTSTNPTSHLLQDPHDIELAGLDSGSTTYHTFLAKVDSLRQLLDETNLKIDEIAHQHTASLARIDDASGADHALESLVAETSALNRQLASEIQRLKSGPHATQRQVQNLEKNVRETFQRYASVERDFQARQREQMVRQLRIARPAASEGEIAAEVDSGSAGSGGIFQSAALESGRSSAAGSALRDAKRRKEEVQRIEKTITELAGLFEQMDQLVTEQEPVVAEIEDKMETVYQDVGEADKHLGGAVTNARALRRHKWMCLGIGVGIVVVIVIIILIIGATQGWFKKDEGNGDGKA